MPRPPADSSPTLFGDHLLPGLPIPLDFDTFWRCYPRKQGKAEARKHWAKLSPADRADAVEALRHWCEFWGQARTETRFIPHGSTWVHQRRWEDDVPELPGQSWSQPTAWDALDQYVQIANAQVRPDMRALGQ